MQSETYVRRRHWPLAEKQLVVDEASATGNVVATAKRHGLQTQQIYRWRERLEQAEPSVGFLPVTVNLDRPAVVPDQDLSRRGPAVVPDRGPRIEIVLGSDCRIVAEGAVDAEILLKLACGLRLSR